MIKYLFILASFHKYTLLFVCSWPNSPQWARASSFTRFLDHTQRRTTAGKTPMISLSHKPLPDNTRNSQQTNIHAPCGFRTHNLSRRAVADLRLTPSGHWDRQWNLKFIILNQQRRLLQIINRF